MTVETDSKLHLALNTAHFEDSVRFYEALFGMAPTKLKDGYAKFDVPHPALNFTLHRVAEATGNRVSHLGIQVPLAPTVLEEKKRLEALGLATRLEQGTECCYSVQDKVWVDDPDGNAWEVFVVLRPIEEHDASYTCCRN